MLNHCSWGRQLPVASVIEQAESAARLHGYRRVEGSSRTLPDLLTVSCHSEGVRRGGGRTDRSPCTPLCFADASCFSVFSS